MKRLCIFLFSLMILSSCGKLGKGIEYAKLAAMATKDKEWINFEIQQTEYLDGEFKWYRSYFVTFHYKDDSSFYAIDDTSRMETSLLDANQLRIVNRMDNELTVFVPQEDDDTWYSQFKFEKDEKLEYVSLYTMLFPKDVRPWHIPAPEQIVDTIVRGCPCKKIVAKHHTSYLWNEETEDYDLPVFYRSTTWINCNTNQIDSVYAYNATDNGFPKSYKIVLKGIDNENREQYFDSIFNFDNSLYSNYSRHTESFPPFSRIGTPNVEVNDTILNYPIVSLDGDTTSINDADGFLLLNFWGFGCEPCYQNLLEYKKQTDSLGYRILEANDIRILAINYSSDNMDLINKIGEKTATTDIMYSAKGMRRFIRIPIIGYFYLFSPDKHIIYEAGNLNDYSELLKAKADWEKQHQKD